MQVNIPYNGRLLYSPAIGKFVLVDSYKDEQESLDHLAKCTAIIIEETRNQFPDAPIHCYELGNKLNIQLKSIVSKIEVIKQEEWSVAK